jgi:hypothetical protein
MLTVETIGRIRREHFVKGKTIKEITRDLKVSRNTVRKVLRSGETAFEYEREVQPRPKLGRWVSALDAAFSTHCPTIRLLPVAEPEPRLPQTACRIGRFGRPSAAPVSKLRQEKKALRPPIDTSRS